MTRGAIAGDLETQEFGLLDEERPEEGVKLTYRAGTQCDGRTGRSLEHRLLCDPAAPAAGEPVAITGDCRFVVTWQTALACPARPRSVAAFAACAVAAVVAYVVAGCLCNAYLGRAAVPYTAHARALAGLVAEYGAAAIGDAFTCFLWPLWHCLPLSTLSSIIFSLPSDVFLVRCRCLPFFSFLYYYSLLAHSRPLIANYRVH